MKGVFIRNKYFYDDGTDYVYRALCKSFGCELSRLAPDLAYDGTLLSPKLDADFVLFWDKNVSLARALANDGLPVFNNADAIEVCDDKTLTYDRLLGKGIIFPKTIPAPYMYRSADTVDEAFLDYVEAELGYPIIVKENRGSRGMQVYKADDRDGLNALYARLKYTPHQYQRFEGDGTDLRMYTVGGKVVGSYLRRGKDFRANLALGGTAERISPPSEYIVAAEKISKLLNMDFGSVDFLRGETPIFLEANSNAYFKGGEELGLQIADEIAKYVKEKVNARS